MLNYIKEIFLAPAHSFLLVMLLLIFSHALALTPFWIASVIWIVLILLDNLITNLWRKNHG